MAIETLRADLLQITIEIIRSINERKNKVRSIQTFKKENNLKSFDPKREKEVFLKLKNDMSHSSLCELLAISLLIEDHAGEDYPKWSERVHIAKPEHKLIEQINPLLLLLIRKDEFNMLHLKSEYKVFNE